MGQRRLAGIEYHGMAGASKECQNAIMRLLQFGDPIVHARMVTHGGQHAFLLMTSIGDRVAVKAGFSSGYTGEGPRRLSYSLQFLHSHHIEIDECEVNSITMDRLNQSALTSTDLNRILDAKPVRPTRWYDHMYTSRGELDVRAWRDFPMVIPLGLVDERIRDIAIDFWTDPDSMLMKAYRRLEDIVREKAGVTGHSAKLFSKVFGGENANLEWEALPDEAERAGRMQLFTGAYMAHRAPRAHRELIGGQSAGLLSEFLLVNHLYRLERITTVSRHGELPPAGPKSGSGPA